MNYLEYELHTKILPYLKQKKIIIPAYDLLSILLTNADFSANLFAVIHYYPQIQNMLLTRPINDYLKVMKKELDTLYSP